MAAIVMSSEVLKNTNRYNKMVPVVTKLVSDKMVTIKSWRHQTVTSPPEMVVLVIGIYYCSVSVSVATGVSLVKIGLLPFSTSDDIKFLRYSCI